jgi:hypothetical protein
MLRLAIIGLISSFHLVSARNSKAVENVTAYTMKGMSKDNFFFGVRAVDKEGNRSPVSFPRPLGRPAPADRAAPAAPAPQQ